MTAAPPGAEAVHPARLHSFTVAALRTTGMSPPHAGQVADVLVDADLSGVTTHGVTLLPRYVALLRAGALNATPDIRIASGKGAVRVMDGDQGMGHLVAAEGMRAAIELAHEHGIGVVAARRSDHFGHAGYYAGMAAQRGMIGHVVTNAPAVMAAWGGSQAVVGNNPLAYGIPTGQGRPPIVLDMACSVVAKGRIRVAVDQGRDIPAGWAIDATGEPTTDAAAALAGAVLPLGDHKGYGLAVVGEVLAGLLPGALFGLQIPNAMSMGTFNPEPWGVGHWLAAIDVAAFRPFDEFAADVAEFAADLKASASPGQEVLLPGELEHRRREQGVANGLSLPPDTRSRLAELAKEIQIPDLNETPFEW